MSVLTDRLSAATPWAPIRHRDLLYLRTDGTEVLVIACDSDGGIGPKPHDVVPIGGYSLGRTAARVPLLELLAAGAVPVAVSDTLAVEMDPTGRDIIAGVVDEIAMVGLGPDALTGSTEDNVPTVATGVGVTVIGRASLDMLRVGTSRPGDRLALVGRPKSAPAHRFDHTDAEILHPGVVRDVLVVPGVVEALPIGSRGPRAEADDLAAGVDATCRIPEWPVPPQDSGGPSTAMILTHRTDIEAIRAATDRPVWPLGALT
ncbi:AIR synthase related protein [Euzebya rosea]|uniref:AIR synthase related protein n=1 Tax=Euzebya rosea TaxID=2052804 RepID=UPI000D3EBDBC|nr:AIR synthase related protein [Euzebya rosea]